MGLAIWIAAGGAAAAAARLIRAGRSPKWIGEVVIAVLSACLLGIVATALDFGGWKEPDWRAGLFALFGTAAVLAMIRLVRLLR